MFLEKAKLFPPESKEALIQTPEEQKLFTGETLPEPIDTTAWDTYQNKWYSPLKTKYDFSGILSPWSKQTLQPKKKPCLKTT
jgi:hypothetical protein